MGLWGEQLEIPIYKQFFFLDGQLEILVAIIIAVYWESSRERSGYATDICRWKLSFLGENNRNGHNPMEKGS